MDEFDGGMEDENESVKASFSIEVVKWKFLTRCETNLETSMHVFLKGAEFILGGNRSKLLRFDRCCLALWIIDTRLWMAVLDRKSGGFFYRY